MMVRMRWLDVIEALGAAAVVVGVLIWLGVAAALIVGGLCLVARANVATEVADARRP